MGIVAAAILITALTACSIGPGLLLLPWMHVDDDEKSVVVVGVSLLSVFFAAFGIYLARLPVGCGWAVTAACVACIGFRWSTLLRLLAHPVVRTLESLGHTSLQLALLAHLRLRRLIKTALVESLVAQLDAPQQACELMIRQPVVPVSEHGLEFGLIVVHLL